MADLAWQLGRMVMRFPAAPHTDGLPVHVAWLDPVEELAETRQRGVVSQASILIDVFLLSVVLQTPAARATEPFGC